MTANDRGHSRLGRFARKTGATIGLLGLLGLAFTVLGALRIVSSEDAVRRFSAWRLGAEYLGAADVVLQEKPNSCGPAALTMVLRTFGVRPSVEEVEERVGLTSRGASMLALKQAASQMGLNAEGWRLSPDDLRRTPMPAIVFVSGDHFAVLDSTVDENVVFLRDPARGKLRMSMDRFERIWHGETLVFERSRPVR